MNPTKVYELSLVKDYVSHWGMKEAVRELIQNSLDSASPFVYEFLSDGDGRHALRLNSEFSQLSPQTLLLGATSKTEDQAAIGSFGEGYKIALLVLTRLGYDVGILNRDVLWKPRFRFNRNFGAEVLVIEETTLSNKVNNGLTFQVEGLTEQDCEEIVGMCLLMQSEIGETKTTTMGEILVDRAGELYVGNLFVCKTELEFGYNVLPKFLRLERDRQTVSGWDLKSVTRDMWYETKQFELIADLIGRECPDLEYAAYSSTELVREACYQHFRSKHPDKQLIARTNAELESLVKQGMTVYVGGGSYHATVSGSSSYKAETAHIIAIPTPVQQLERWLGDNRKAMRGAAIESFKKDILNGIAKSWRNI